MNGIADAIQQFFAGASDSLTPFLAALSVLGVATMAIIQTLKDVFPVRNWYHHVMLNRWLRQGEDEARLNLLTAIPSLRPQGVDAAQARQQLVRLAVDGDADALTSLSIEQLCGQMNSAVQLALDYPKRYPDLLLIAGSNAEPNDLYLLANPEVAASPDARAANATLADARNRVVHQIQRAIDGFQIRAAFRWKWILQLASFVLSVGLAMAAIAAWPSDKGEPSFGAVLLTAVFAGFLAPVARDLTATLQKLRG